MRGFDSLHVLEGYPPNDDATHICVKSMCKCELVIMAMTMASAGGIIRVIPSSTGFDVLHCGDTDTDFGSDANRDHPEHLAAPFSTKSFLRPVGHGGKVFFLFP